MELLVRMTVIFAPRIFAATELAPMRQKFATTAKNAPPISVIQRTAPAPTQIEPRELLVPMTAKRAPTIFVTDLALVFIQMIIQTLAVTVMPVRKQTAVLVELVLDRIPKPVRRVISAIKQGLAILERESVLNFPNMTALFATTATPAQQQINAHPEPVPERLEIVMM